MTTGRPEDYDDEDGEWQMSQARCAGCDHPVEKIGDTCSLPCYAYMVDLISHDVPLEERLKDLYAQPWYPAHAEKIRKVAELHEDTIVHEVFGSLDS